MIILGCALRQLDYRSSLLEDLPAPIQDEMAVRAPGVSCHPCQLGIVRDQAADYLVHGQVLEVRYGFGRKLGWLRRSRTFRIKIFSRT